MSLECTCILACLLFTLLYFFTNWYFSSWDSLSGKGIMVFSIEFCSPTAFQDIGLSNWSLLGYGVPRGYLCKGHCSIRLFGEKHNLAWEGGRFLGKGEIPEKQAFKGFVIFRKTSCKNTRKASCPKGFAMHSSGDSALSLYTGSLSSNQPLKSMKVTRWTKRTIQKSWRSTERPSLQFLLLFSYF